jgi:hypothetical protein
VITYVSFRSTVPPPDSTLFGRAAGEGLAVPAACTNPAALAGGSGELHAYLSTDGSFIVGTRAPEPWVNPKPNPEKPIDTPWVSVPGLLTSRCATNDHATYLEVTVHGDPSDPRTDEIVGDLIANVGGSAQVLANWGLHLVDMNLAMGNLLDIVGRQARAWLAMNATAAGGEK